MQRTKISGASTARAARPSYIDISDRIYCAKCVGWATKSGMTVTEMEDEETEDEKVFHAKCYVCKLRF